MPENTNIIKTYMFILDTFCNFFYYMASSASGQDESNPVL